MEFIKAAAIKLFTDFLDSSTGRALLFFAAMCFGLHLWKVGAKDTGLLIIGGAWSAFLALLKPQSNQ